MQTVGERLKKARTAIKLKQGELAAKCMWGEKGQRRVSNYERGHRTPTPKDAEKLAKILQVSPTWILFGEETSPEKTIEEKTKIVSREIPLLQLCDCENFLSGTLINFNTMAYISAQQNIYEKENIFFVKIVGDSMYSPENPLSLRDGEFALIDPTIIAKEGDFVIVSSNQSVKIRQLAKDGTDTILKPLNSRYPIIPFDQNTKILGVIEEVTRKYRK